MLESRTIDWTHVATALISVLGGGALWAYAAKRLRFKLQSKEVDADIAQRMQEAQHDDVQFIIERNREFSRDMQREVTSAKKEARKVYDDYIALRLENTLLLAKMSALEAELVIAKERNAALEKGVAK